MLLHIPQVLTPQEVTEFRRLLDNAEWTDGRETVGHQGEKVKRNEQLPDTSPLKEQLSGAILAALRRSPLFFAAVLPAKILPPRFNRYAGGGEYGYHVDGAIMTTNDGKKLRSDVSCTVFLCDPEEYDGGRLVISDTYGDQVVAKVEGNLVQIEPEAR